MGSKGATSGGTMGQERTVGSRGATSGGTMGQWDQRVPLVVGRWDRKGQWD